MQQTADRNKSSLSRNVTKQSLINTTFWRQMNQQTQLLEYFITEVLPCYSYSSNKCIHLL